MIVSTPISPKRYGKGYKFLQQMGYQCKGSLNNTEHILVEPLRHTFGQQPKDTTGLGYGAEDDPPECSRDAPMTSESDTNMDE